MEIGLCQGNHLTPLNVWNRLNSMEILKWHQKGIWILRFEIDLIVWKYWYSYVHY